MDMSQTMLQGQNQELKEEAASDLANGRKKELGELFPAPWSIVDGPLDGSIYSGAAGLTGSWPDRVPPAECLRLFRRARGEAPY